MAIQPFNKNVSIHQSLGNEPNTENNMSADEVKKLFDLPAEEIVKYINEVIVPCIEGLTPGMSLTFSISATKPRFSPTLWLDISGQNSAEKGVLKYIDAAGTVFPFSPVVDAQSVGGLMQILSEASRTYIGTIGNIWYGNEPPYTQTIPVAGMLASDEPIVDLTPSETFSEAEAQMEAYAHIYRLKSDNGFITVYSDEKTQTPIPIRMKIFRPEPVSSHSGSYDATLLPGSTGPIVVSADGEDYPMSNAELGAFPSAPGKYSFEII